MILDWRQHATQDWIEKPCADAADPSVDLRFQFGTLDIDQESFIQKPTKYAAIEIRTDYNSDDAKMRGKGLIYVSPLQGRLAYEGATAAPDLWQKEEGEFLYLLLLHELGHVFGLPHMGSFGELMSEGFAESVLQFTGATHADDPTFQHFFSLPTVKQFCPQAPLSAILRRFFGSPDNRPCLRFKYTHDVDNQLTEPTTMQVFALRDLADEGELIGQAHLTMTGYFPGFSTTIIVPPVQNVFTDRDLAKFNLKNHVLGISLIRVSKKGHFRSTDHRLDRSISVSFEQGKSTTLGSGVNDGELWDSFF